MTFNSCGNIGGRGVVRERKIGRTSLLALQALLQHYTASSVATNLLLKGMLPLIKIKESFIPLLN